LHANATILGVLSLALIGNASGQAFGARGISTRGVFDKETRRKPLAFAADAVRYGISTAVGGRIEQGENTGELDGWGGDG